MISAPPNPLALTPRGFALPGTPEGPSFGEVVGAAFQLENSVVNAFRSIKEEEEVRDPSTGLRVRDLDPDAWIEETNFRDSRYEQMYMDRFTGVQSTTEARLVMSRIDREEKLRETLSRGGTTAFFARMAAGLLSPTSLIPIAGWYGAIARTARLARAGAGAAAAAVSGAGAMVLDEAVLQGAQELRTPLESALNVAGAALLSGVLGGAAAAFTRPQLAALGATLQNIPATRAEQAAAFRALAGMEPVSAGAAATAEARGTGELASALGAERLFGQNDPMIRLQRSGSLAARDTVRDLAETPLMLAENERGIATSIGGAVETQATLAQAPLATALRELDTQFASYWGGDLAGRKIRSELARIAGMSTGGRLSYSQFKEAVFDALLAGDVHEIAQVQASAVAFRRVFDQLRDEAIAANVPGFREAVEAAQAAGIDAGYIYRVYDTGAIVANRTRFVDILTQHFAARQGDLERRVADLELAGEKIDPGLRKSADLSPDEIRSIAEETTDTILGHSPARMMTPADIVAGPRGPLKERTLQIPTRLIREFVERDPEVLARMATRTMATDTALVKKFGSTDMAEQIRKINDEANARIGAVPDGPNAEKMRKAIDDERRDDIRDITGIRDRLRGTYAIPKDPDGLVVRAARVTRNLNYLRLLGGMTLSAVPDLARSVFSHGLSRTLRTVWAPLTGELSKFKLAANEVKLAGEALDMILDSRTMALADIMDDYGRGSRFERGLSAATRKFGIVSLMAPWNAALKQFVGVITQTRMLQAIEKVVAGTASKKEISYLAAGGIDANVAERIWNQFAKAGDRDGEVWWANTEGWADREAVQSFRAFLVRDVNKTIVTPGQDKPLWMSTELGKTVGQFKSFAVASIQRTILSGLQQRDMAALNGMMLMLGLGAVTYWVKATNAGMEISKDPAKWATEALDYSGLTGWLMEANNMAESLTGGRVGLSAITGERATRYASRNAIGAALGPTFDLLGDLSQATRAISSGEWTESDIHALRKILPLQNLFYLRQLLDAAEAGVANKFGIQARAA